MIKNINEKNVHIDTKMWGIWSKESMSLLCLLVNKIQWCLVGLCILIIFNNAGSYLFWFCFSWNLIYKKIIYTFYSWGLFTYLLLIYLWSSQSYVFYLGKQQLFLYTFKPSLVVFGWNVDFSIQNKVGCFLKKCKLNW